MQALSGTDLSVIQINNIIETGFIRRGDAANQHFYAVDSSLLLSITDKIDDMIPKISLLSCVITMISDDGVSLPGAAGVGIAVILDDVAKELTRCSKQLAARQ